jgi:DNA-directed RNA polymerase subunit F
MTQDRPNQLDRLEAALTRFAEITIQNAVRHDQALNQLEASALRHDQALTKLEESALRHDQALTRLEESAERHSDRLDRIEEQQRQNIEAIANLATQINLLGNRVDALTTTTTETIQLVAINSQQIARSNERIEQILEYLFQQRPNGRGTNENWD